MLRWIVFAAAALLTFTMRGQLSPFIAAAVLAYMLAHPVRLFSTYIGRSAAVAVVYMLTLGGLAFALAHFVPKLVNELTSLYGNREAILQAMAAHVYEFSGWQPDVALITASMSEHIQGFLSEKPDEILAFGHLITHSFITMMIFIVSSIYMVVDGEKIGHFALRFVPEDRRDEVSQMALEIDGKFSRYLVGQLSLIVIMSVFAFIVLSLNGVHYALLLALLTGVLEILPIFGPMLALGVVFAVASAQLGLAPTAVVLAILYAGRMVEDYVVVPRVVGQAVHLSPLVTIFAVICGETIGGGLGMLLSIPTAAAVKVVLDRLLPPLALALPTADDAAAQNPSTVNSGVSRQGKFPAEVNNQGRGSRKKNRNSPQTKAECERCLAIRARLKAILFKILGFFKLPWRRS